MKRNECVILAINRNEQSPMGMVQLRNETWYRKGLQNKVSSNLNLKEQEGRNKGDQ